MDWEQRAMLMRHLQALKMEANHVIDALQEGGLPLIADAWVDLERTWLDLSQARARV